MGNSLNHLLLRAILGLALLNATITLADEDRWFRVELMVFSHTGGQYAERWNPTPTLSYPETVRYLIEPGGAYPAVDSAVEEYGDPADTLTGVDTAPAPANLPTPFVVRADAEQEFRAKAAYMQRSGRYRILFHETWVQPVRQQSLSLPIVVEYTGNDHQWPELQGTIQLYLSRYLHLRTNLWLNTQGEYFPGNWRMPPPPFGPSPVSVTERPIGPEVPGTPGLEEPVQEASPEHAEALEFIYPYRHAVLLQQKRRMRSSEVHYLDHPMLGVVTKVTPLTPEELEILARAEAVNADPWSD